MRIAVISDIHGNFEAFKKILIDIDNSDIDLIVNLGDSVGYGPDPEMVLCLIEKQGIINIIGNHEHAILDETYRQFFTQGAHKSIEQTMKFLTSASLLYLKRLPKFRVLNGALFVHACPPASYTIYLNHLSIPEIESAFKSFSNRMCFVGHTHRLNLFSYNGDTVNFQPLQEETIALRPHLRYIVNVGSVGQPRDNDSRAGYTIWDSVQDCLEVRRLSYDIKSTVDKIIKRGFLKRDADRLIK